MNTKEPRRIWLITLNGAPQECAWAMVKTAAEASEAGSWASALGPEQLLADGWDATPTQWRRVPRVAQGGVAHLGVLVGREFICGGLRYNVDTGGRVHDDHKPDDEREPYEPDAVVDDEAAVLAFAEAERDQAQAERDARHATAGVTPLMLKQLVALGLAPEEWGKPEEIDYGFVEQDTLKRWRVSTDPAAVLGAEDVLISRRAGVFKRSERPR